MNTVTSCACNPPSLQAPTRNCLSGFLGPNPSTGRGKAASIIPVHEKGRTGQLRGDFTGVQCVDGSVCYLTEKHPQKVAKIQTMATNPGLKLQRMPCGEIWELSPGKRIRGGGGV